MATGGKDAAASPKMTPKTTRKASVTGRPLVPVTERRSQEDKTLPRGGKDSDAQKDRGDITPEGGSAGREGRQFTVSNVGNNGRIYLRYAVPCLGFLLVAVASIPFGSQTLTPMCLVLAIN